MCVCDRLQVSLLFMVTGDKCLLFIPSIGYFYGRSDLIPT